MNILLVTSFWDSNDGGLAKACKAFAEMLTAHDHRIFVVASPEVDILGSKTLELTRESPNPNMYFFRESFTLIPGGYKQDINFHIRFSAFIRQAKKDLSGYPLDVCIAFGAGFNGLFASHLADALLLPLIVCLRGSDINLSLSNMPERIANRECLLKARAVVSLSNELRSCAKMIEPLSPARYFVIPNAASNLRPYCGTRPINRAEDETTSITLGIASRFLNEKKGVGTAIKVISLLAKNYPEFDWRLDLVGEIDKDLLNKYILLAQAEKVDDRISFLGLQSREDWLIRAKGWDASVQMSFFEGFSNSNIESWSAGVPVIFTDTGFIAEQLRLAHPELILPIGSNDEIPEKIMRLFSKYDLADMSNRAIRLLQPVLSPEKVWSQWSEVLNYVTNKVQSVQKTTGTSWVLTVLFHDISEDRYSPVDIPKHQFEDFVMRINSRGYNLCSAEDYSKSLDGKQMIICTFDDAYEGVFCDAYPILRSMGFTATVFVTTDDIGCDNKWNPKDQFSRNHMTMDQLKELHDHGWEIGSHGTRHVSHLRLNRLEIENSLRRSKEILGHSLGEISSFAYPYGDYNEQISKQASLFYKHSFATNNGGNHWMADSDRIRRYSATEILKIIGA